MMRSTVLLCFRDLFFQVYKNARYYRMFGIDWGIGQAVHSGFGRRQN